MPAGTAILTSPDTVVTSPRPAVMRSIRTSPLALRTLAEPSALPMVRSPLAEFTVTSPPARPMPVSPDAVLTWTAPAASSSRTSPDAVLMLTGPAVRSTVTSPLAVRASREPSSPLQRTSADAALSTHDEPSGNRTTRSSGVLLSSRTRSGTVTVSVPAASSTVAAAMSSSPRLPACADVSDTVAVVTGSACTVMLPAGSLASRVIGPGAGISQVVIVLLPSLIVGLGWCAVVMGRTVAQWSWAGLVTARSPDEMMARSAAGIAGDPLADTAAGSLRSGTARPVQFMDRGMDEPAIERQALARRSRLDPRLKRVGQPQGDPGGARLVGAVRRGGRLGRLVRFRWRC